jgi:hypothetical protein
MMMMFFVVCSSEPDEDEANAAVWDRPFPSR